MQKLILLIDDDKEEAYILDQAILLGELPHICVWADCFEKAERLLKHIQPDVILIDYNMPKTNGLECLDKLSERENLREASMVMYSNDITDLTREHALSKGATCIQKHGSILSLVQYLIKLSGEGRVLHSLA